MTNLDFESPRFLSQEQVEHIEENFGSPCYIYSEGEWEKAGNEFLNFPNAYGLEVKFAMKACSNKNILKFYSNMGIGMDASSEYEVYRALDAGVSGDKISLVTQELPSNLDRVLNSGVFYIASSLHQLEEVCKTGKIEDIGVRINIGLGSGYSAHNLTGGANSSFGIWYECVPEILTIAKKYNVKISLVHIHIGSGNSVESWLQSADSGLTLLEDFIDATTLDLGGGFKIGITPDEVVPDLQKIGTEVKKKFKKFYDKTGRKIRLAVEPGKYLSANTCSFVSKIVDIVSTQGEGGKDFIKLNSGMNDMPRVAMYGVQEAIYIMNNSEETHDYGVVGHCCESGDIKTVELYKPGVLELRSLKKANVGDLVVIDGTGGYNASMAMKNYNSFPESAELLLRKDGTIVEIRKRQQLEDIWKNEISVI